MLVLYKTYLLSTSPKLFQSAGEGEGQECVSGSWEAFQCLKERNFKEVKHTILKIKFTGSNHADRLCCSLKEIKLPWLSVLVHFKPPVFGVNGTIIINCSYLGI